MSESKETDPGAVPGRGCGECAICCIAPRIDDPALQKAPGLRCVNLTAANRCGIYEQRPSVCRSFLCGWRLFPELGDEWRPDRSGILLTPDFDAMPGYRAPTVRMQVANAKILFAAPVLNYVCGMIAAGTPVYLTLGQLPVKTFLNPHLAAPIAANDANAISAILLGIVRAQAETPSPRKIHNR